MSFSFDYDYITCTEDMPWLPRVRLDIHVRGTTCTKIAPHRPSTPMRHKPGRQANVAAVSEAALGARSTCYLLAVPDPSAHHSTSHLTIIPRRRRSTSVATRSHYAAVFKRDQRVLSFYVGIQRARVLRARPMLVNVLVAVVRD